MLVQVLLLSASKVKDYTGHRVVFFKGEFGILNAYTRLSIQMLGDVVLLFYLYQTSITGAHVYTYAPNYS